MSATQTLTLKTQNSATDWHCHLLPGIDDGPATMNEAVQMAKMLSQSGFSTVHCTPHLIKGSFEADNDTVRMVLAALQEELDLQKIDLRLFTGREYYLDEFLIDVLKEPLPLGETKFLLIEIPSHAPVEFVKETCYRVSSSGYTPMIAHPERCALIAQLPQEQESLLKKLLHVFDVKGFNSKFKTLQAQTSEDEKTSLLGYLKDLGCAFQGNLGSFTGRYGERTRLAAERLREAGVYTHYGSDAHVVEHIRGLHLPPVSTP